MTISPTTTAAGMMTALRVYHGRFEGAVTVACAGTAASVAPGWRTRSVRQVVPSQYISEPGEASAPGCGYQPAGVDDGVVLLVSDMRLPFGTG